MSCCVVRRGPPPEDPVRQNGHKPGLDSAAASRAVARKYDPAGGVKGCNDTLGLNSKL
jgi:hypothetical protein